MSSAHKRRVPTRHRPPTAIVSLADSELTSQAQRDRRVRILHAAAAIAAESGYDEVFMRAVARRAAVALGTLYRYFPSKDHLLVAVFGIWLDRMCDELAAVNNNGEPAHERLTTVVGRLNDAATQHPRLTEAMATAYLSADSSAAIDVENVRTQMTEMLAETLGGTASANTSSSDVAALLADVWAANVLALARKRSTAAELHHRMQTTIALVARGHSHQGG